MRPNESTSAGRFSFGRLNGDATWWCAFEGTRVLFDPWLTGSEIDGFAAFHQAWHTEPVVPPDALPTFDLIVVSQQFADHCHAETLKQLHGPVAAVRGCGLRHAASIPAWGADPLEVAGLRVWRLSKPLWRPPPYHAIVVANAEGRAVLHAPHGCPASDAAPLAERFQLEVVAVSRVRYALPLLLGGTVAPGNEAAVALVETLRPRHAMQIHDEAKRSEGLVPRVSRTDRGPFPEDGLPWVAPSIEPPPA